MKRLFFLVTLVFMSHNAFSQGGSEGSFMIDENTLIKDETGNKIELFKLMELLNSGDFTLYPILKNDGQVAYMQLRKATAEEKKMFAEMALHANQSNDNRNRVPDFNFTDVHGNQITKTNTLGKVVVINFWFTTCKPCIAEIPELNEVYEKFKTDTNVVFASVTYENRKTVKKFLKKQPLNYPVICDAQAACDLFKIQGYPTNMIIDKNGNYQTIIAGGTYQIGNEISTSIQNALDGIEKNISYKHSEGLTLDPKAVYKLENGEIIGFDKVLELLNSKEYSIDPIVKGEEKYFLLKKNY